MFSGWNGKKVRVDLRKGYCHYISRVVRVDVAFPVFSRLLRLGNALPELTVLQHRLTLLPAIINDKLTQH
jgi:hypothetical protein